MNSTTTLQTQEAADSAVIQLEPVLKKIRNELDSGLDIIQVRAKHSEEIGSIIATMIRTSYLLGHGFIEKFAKRTILFSESSLQQMNLEIQNAIEVFWSRLDSTYKKEQEKKSEVFGAAGESGILASFLHFASQLATTFSFKSLGKATILTMKQNAQDRILQIKVQTTITSTENGTTTIQTPVSQPVPSMLIWVSERDNRVCPTCLNLDGRTFDANDDTTPAPGPDDLGGATHWGCRCRQLPYIDGKAFSA